MHDKCGPSPCPPNLNAIPGFVFDRFTHVWEAKGTSFGDRRWCNASPSYINCHCFMPNGPHERGFFPGPKQIPHLRPIKLVVSWEIALPYIRRACGSQVHVDNIVSTKLSGVVEKTITLYPMPTVRFPVQGITILP